MLFAVFLGDLCTSNVLHEPSSRQGSLGPLSKPLHGPGLAVRIKVKDGILSRPSQPEKGDETGLTFLSPPTPNVPL